MGFVALLKRYESEGSRLAFALPDAEIAIGRIAVVASDHVEVADLDGRTLLIPAGAILATIRSTDPH